MHDKLREFAKQELRIGLGQLEDRHRLFFKRMYGSLGGRRSAEKIASLTIDDVLTEMSDDQLQNAMDQVDRTIRKITKGENHAQTEGLDREGDGAKGEAATHEAG